MLVYVKQRHHVAIRLAGATVHILVVKIEQRRRLIYGGNIQVRLHALASVPIAAEWETI